VFDIRYASIRELDISNGEGIGISLFVQGCHFKCFNCFNSETWDFNGGNEWTEETKNKFLELATRPYIKRISILGGEPLADENVDEVLNLVNEIRLSFGDTKTIWLYTGFYFEEIIDSTFTIQLDGWINDNLQKIEKRREIISKCDVLIDGRYIDIERNPSLKWRGSSNQSVIDIKRTLKQGEVVLWQT